LSLVFFKIFINDLESGIKCSLSKFADNTKLSGTVDTIKIRDVIQRDLDRLDKWTHMNLIGFNTAKCKESDFGQGNPRCASRLREKLTGNNSTETDFEVIVDEKPNASQKCALAVWKAKSVLDYLKRGVASKENAMIVLFCSPLVRPHQEYCIQS